MKKNYTHRKVINTLIGLTQKVKVKTTSVLLISCVSLTGLSGNPEKNKLNQPWANKGLKNEIEAKRTRTTKHFSNGNSTTAFMAVGSIHYKNANNSWEDINTNIESNPSSISYPYSAEKNAVKTYFPANPFNNSILMDIESSRFKEKVNAIQFLDASKNIIGSLSLGNNVVSTVSGNKITYTGFYPGLSLSYSLGNDSRKFDLEITSSLFLNAIPNNAAFISIDEMFQSDDSNFSIKSSKNQLVVDVNGLEVIGFENPIAFDANTAAENRAIGNLTYTKNNNQYSLRTNFPVSWIKSSQRVFPIHLDPTVNYFPQNIAMWTGYQTSNAAKASGYLRLAGATTASWAKFDISALPVGAFVQSANYWAYHYTTLGLITANLRGLGTLDPVPAVAGPLFTQSTTGPLYTSGYTFAGTAFAWYSGVLNPTGTAGIMTAMPQGWFGIGVEWAGGSTGFAYAYGINGTALQYPYLEVTYFTTPCAGTPDQSNVTAPNTTICPNANPGLLTLTTSYTTSGIQYQWESSNGINGAYTSVSNATNSSLSTGTLGSTAAYRCIITCTNGPSSTTSMPILINVGAPAISSAVPIMSLVCPNGDGSLSLGANYGGLGVNYQWQTSTLSIAGPFGNVTSGTNAATSGTAATYVTPSLTNTTYYQAVLSCSAVPSLSTVTLPTFINIAGTTTNSVPYFEGFEGITVNNQFPNCSWSASNPTIVCQTSTISNINNQTPNSGAKFGSFKAPTALMGDYFYTNGIYLEPGITYSASVWYITSGALGWTNFSMLLGTTQSVLSLTNIASTGSSNMVNTYYKNLSSTFTVSSAGMYNLALKGVGSGSSFLTFDDISITAPCSLNSPSVNVSPANASGCIGQSIILNAFGANTYIWNNSVNTSSLSYLVTGNGVISVVGTNSSSGCSSTVNIPVSANLSPQVGILVPSTSLCRGSSLVLTAYGANSYAWTNGANTATTIVSPTVNTTYTVVGLNSFGCSAAVAQAISVRNIPPITALASSESLCSGETATLTVTGANNYTWTSNSTFLVGSQVVVAPMAGTTNYTVVGSDLFNCSNNAFITVNTSACLGINESNDELSTSHLFPNPNNGEFVLSLNANSVTKVQVLDVTGRIVFSDINVANESNLKLNQLAAGVYYVKITNDNASKTLKFVKE